MNTIIFFDINGTLIERDARTDLPFSEAADDLLGKSNVMDGVDTAARSDKDVFMEVLNKQNIPFTNELWEKLLGIYKTKLEKYKNHDVWRPNSDCIEYVKSLSQNTGLALSLITGELSIGAEFKLKKIGLWDYFKTGGFGEDGLRRFDIAESALKKAEDLFEKKFESIWVIGDTILDIQTARHLNAKSIAIATGAHSKDTLSEHSPDFLIECFSQLPSNLF